MLKQIVVPPGPTIGSILPNGKVQLSGSGVPNWVYTVQASEDLGDANGWHVFGTGESGR